MPESMTFSDKYGSTVLFRQSNGVYSAKKPPKPKKPPKGGK